MSDFNGFPYFEVEFNKQGEVHDQGQVDQLMNFLAAGGTSDLFVISHGWNNDMADARGLYDRFSARLRQVIDAGAVPGVGGRTFAIMAVLWPSKKFTEKELIASGAAGAESPTTNDLLREELDDLKGVFDHPDADAAIDKAKQLVPDLEDDPAARREFADLLRSVLPPEASSDDGTADDFMSLPGDQVIDRLSKPAPITFSQPTDGGAAAIDEDMEMEQAAARRG